MNRTDPLAPPWRDPRRLLRFLAASAALIIAAHLLDWWSYRNLLVPSLGESDLGRMLRVIGYLPFWIVAATALVLSEPQGAHGLARWRRGLLLLGSASVGGIVAELLKITIRRARPDARAGEYVFRSWADQPFHTGGLGLPSSHALVGFAAVAMLAILFPRARPVWYLLGIGCAFTRVAAGAHFLSDVAVSAVLGFMIATLLHSRFARARDTATT